MTRLIESARSNIRDSYPNIRITSSHDMVTGEYYLYLYGEVEDEDLKFFRVIYPKLNIERRDEDEAKSW